MRLYKKLKSVSYPYYIDNNIIDICEMKNLIQDGNITPVRLKNVIITHHVLFIIFCQPVNWSLSLILADKSNAHREERDFLQIPSNFTRIYREWLLEHTHVLGMWH